MQVLSSDNQLIELIEEDVIQMNTLSDMLQDVKIDEPVKINIHSSIWELILDYYHHGKTVQEQSKVMDVLNAADFLNAHELMCSIVLWISSIPLKSFGKSMIPDNMDLQKKIIDLRLLRMLTKTSELVMYEWAVEQGLDNWNAMILLAMRKTYQLTVDLRNYAVEKNKAHLINYDYLLRFCLNDTMKMRMYEWSVIRQRARACGITEKETEQFIKEKWWLITESRMKM